MGNELQKQYGLKQFPLKLPGAYNFLKHADHPNDKTSSLIIIKLPHKAGIISSDIILPIKDIKNLNNDYSVATTARCKPIGLIKPRSETQLKILMSQIIKLGAQIGRIFLCDGKLMLWCQQVHNTWSKSPEQIQTGKIRPTSKIFWGGLALLNYLNYVYEKEVSTSKKKKDSSKNQMRNYFNPKDKKQYIQFIMNIESKLSKTNFWDVVSDGMKNLLVSMLAKQHQQRINMNELKNLQYFSEDKQLRLYTILVDQMPKYQQKQTIIFMETLEMVIKNRIIFDQLILQQYLTPLLITLLKKKPEMIISCIVQLPEPPIKQIFIILKKAHPQNYRLLSVVLNKKELLHRILQQQDYDMALARTAFCCFESQQMIIKILDAIPYCLETIQEANYRKQIEFQLITNILQTELTQNKLLLPALKCIIIILRKNLISNVAKLFNLKFQPRKFIDDFQINLHILELYRLMILQIDPSQVMGIMMPKLNPYLSDLDLSHQIFFMAKRCVDLMINKLQQVRQISPQDETIVDYQQQFFSPIKIQLPNQQQKIEVLDKQAQKSKDPNIAWLSCILTKQKYLLQ